MSNLCPRKSVGAIIEKDGEFLLIDRVNIPHGWAGVAGHVDDGKTPEEMIGIEVEEEVGLKIISAELVLEEMVTWNNCWRSNDEGHYWYVFEVEAGGQIKIEEEEVRGFGWFTREEMQYLELEPVWRYWFEKLGYIQPIKFSEGG